MPDQTNAARVNAVGGSRLFYQSPDISDIVNVLASVRRGAAGGCRVPEFLAVGIFCTVWRDKHVLLAVDTHIETEIPGLQCATGTKPVQQNQQGIACRGGVVRGDLHLSGALPTNL